MKIIPKFHLFSDTKMRTKSNAQILIAIFLVYFSSHSAGAEIDSKLDSHKNVIITIDGPFLSGDSDKFRKLFESATARPLIQLNSPGGSVAEAVKIGEMIWQARAWTSVREGDTCASACFLTWINGSSRHALNAKIGLHRPFSESTQNTEESIKEQVKTIDQVSRYLTSKLVPRRIIETMMAHTSNEIYWLDADEIYYLSGTREDLKDLFIAHCGGYSDQVLRSVTTSEKMTEWRRIRRCEEQLNNEVWGNQHTKTNSAK